MDYLIRISPSLPAGHCSKGTRQESEASQRLSNIRVQGCLQDARGEYYESDTARGPVDVS